MWEWATVLKNKNHKTNIINKSNLTPHGVLTLMGLQHDHARE